MTESDEAKQPDPTAAEAVPTEAASAKDAPEPPPPAGDAARPASDGATKGAPWRMVAAVGVVVAIAALGVVTWPQWRDAVAPTRVEAPPAPIPAPAPPAPAPTPAPGPARTATAELDALRARVAELEARPSMAGDTTATERLDRLERSVEALAARPEVPLGLVKEVEALSTQLAETRKTTADAAAVLRLADRLDKVEAELRDIQSRRSSAAALLLAVGQLREAVNGAMPFEAELRAVRALAPQDSEMAGAMDTLKPRAAAGIPTRMVLAERFGALAPALVRSDLLPAGQSWWRDTVNRMASLLTVRREDGEAAGKSPAAVVARAQAALRRGDLAGAVAQAETLDATAAETVAPWLADARARLAADKALGVLTAAVVTAVGPRQ